MNPKRIFGWTHFGTFRALVAGCTGVLGFNVEEHSLFLWTPVPTHSTLEVEPRFFN